MARNRAYCDVEVIHEDVVNDVRRDMPREAVFSRVTELFKAFADDLRVQILWSLSRRDLCVCDLAALLKISKSAVSHKLKYLRDLHLVDFRKEGRIALYYLIDDHVRTILSQGFEHEGHLMADDAAPPRPEAPI